MTILIEIGPRLGLALVIGIFVAAATILLATAL